MADSKELINALRDLFHTLCDNDEELKKIAEKLGNGTYSDAHDYSLRIGQLLSQAFSKVLTEDVYPEITEDIARQVIPSLLGTDHKMVSEACVAVQTNLNKQAGLGLKAVEPEFNVSRAYDLAEKYADCNDYEEAKSALEEPVENFSQSIPDDSVRRNAEFHSKVGMSPKIIRKAEPSGTRTVKRGKRTYTYKVPCDWCSKLARTYEYKDVKDTGNDVYRRHPNCRCMVDYVPADGKKRQDVWSKAEWEGDDPEARKKAVQEKEEELKRSKEYQAGNRKRRYAAVERIQRELGYSPKGASIWYNQNKKYIDKYGMDYMLDYERNSTKSFESLISPITTLNEEIKRMELITESSVTGSYDKFDKEVIEIINNRLELQFKKYPQLKNIIGEITTVDDKNVLYFMVAGDINQFKTSLNLNPRFLRSKMELMNMIHNNVEKNIWSEKDGVEGLVDHECAHMLEFYECCRRQNIIPLSYTNDQETERIQAYNDYANNIVAKEIIRQAEKNLNFTSESDRFISVYATINEGEQLAEARSDLSNNIYSKEIYKVSEEIFNDAGARISDSTM